MEKLGCTYVAAGGPAVGAGLWQLTVGGGETCGNGLYTFCEVARIVNGDTGKGSCLVID